MSEPVLSSPEAPRRSRSRAAARQLWLDRLQRFPASGLTPAQFCAAEGVSLASFYLWKRRLAAPGHTPVAPDAGPRLLPVRLGEPAVPLELQLPSGAIVRIAAGADPATLRALLHALGVCSC